MERKMDAFDWTLLQSFLAVSETGSFSAAARQTGRSQPTIGRHIAELQSQLGTVLFHRAEGGYALTATGTKLVEHAMGMRAAAARISLIAEGHSDNLQGTVRVTASEIVATYILPQFFAQLLAEEPGLQIELVATNSTENLLLREADIAVRMAKPSQQDLIARKLGEINLGLFAAPSYLARCGTPESLEELADHIFLGYDRSDIILRGMQQFGMTPDRSFFAFRTDDQVTYHEALRAGVGIGAAQVIQAESFGLVRLFPDLYIEPLPVWLAAHQELRTSAKVRRVFDFLVEALPASLK